MEKCVPFESLPTLFLPTPGASNGSTWALPPNSSCSALASASATTK
jgi:hypothetical protein